MVKFVSLEDQVLLMEEQKYVMEMCGLESAMIVGLTTVTITMVQQGLLVLLLDIHNNVSTAQC